MIWIGILWVIWTFMMGFIGYHYGYEDGWGNADKEWRKKIKGLKEKILERKIERSSCVNEMLKTCCEEKLSDG